MYHTIRVMKYKGTYFDMTDTWYLNVGGSVHGFHLKMHDGDDWNVGHICTDDLLHFHKLTDILNPLPEEEYPDDCLGKYTGCAIEKDGVYYLYYTMRDRVCSEKIGLAISTDLIHFQEYENNPVLTPNPELFVVHPKGRKTDCRDMLVVYDKERKKYFGYFAAMANISNRSEIGVIGVAESSDLLCWDNQKIVYIPDFQGTIEVPNVFFMNGKWYMTLMTGTRYGAKGAVDDPNLNSYIIWVSSDTPDGNFKREKDNVFLGSTRINNGYALRCVEFQDKLYALYVDRSEYGAAISLPKEVRVENGVIKPFYTPILKKLRTGKSWEKMDFSLIPPGYAWSGVRAGDLFQKDNRISLTTYENSIQAFQTNGVCGKSIETEFVVFGNFAEAGLVLYCTEQKTEREYKSKNGVSWQDYVWGAYYISFDTVQNLVVLSEGMVDPICRRQFEFQKNESYHVRVIAMEGQLELYIDDVMFIQCGIKTRSYITPGLFAFSGKAEFENFKVYELEA